VLAPTDQKVDETFDARRHVVFVIHRRKAESRRLFRTRRRRNGLSHPLSPARERGVARGRADHAPGGRRTACRTGARLEAGRCWGCPRSSARRASCVLGCACGRRRPLASASPPRGRNGVGARAGVPRCSAHATDHACAVTEAAVVSMRSRCPRCASLVGAWMRFVSISLDNVLGDHPVLPADLWAKPSSRSSSPGGEGFRVRM